MCSCSVQHWGLAEVFWGDRIVPEFLQSPRVPIDPRSCCKVEGGWSQVWSSFGCSSGGLEPGECWVVLKCSRGALGRLREMGGYWLASGEGWSADPGEMVESRGEGRWERTTGGVRVIPPAPWIPVGGHQNAGGDPWWPKPPRLLTMDSVG